MSAAEKLHPGPAEWMAFMGANGRIPFADDEVPCWEYSGWLRFLVLQAEDMGALLPRWHYVFETLAEGHVPERPLPSTIIGGQGQDEKAMRILMGWMDLLDGRRSHWERIRLVMEYLAYGFGIGSPPDISREEARRLYAGVETKRKARRGVNSRDLLELYKTEVDLFGRTFCESMGSGWNPNAFFPTPAPVVACMVEMLMHDERRDQRGLTVCDPCCGTGRMLLHAGQRSMRLFGQDIDGMMVLATKINLAFFAPWGLFDWDDSYFDVVGDGAGGVRVPDVPHGHEQLALFNATIREDVKNKGRKRRDIEREIYVRQATQIGLFGGKE